MIFKTINKIIAIKTLCLGVALATLTNTALGDTISGKVEQVPSLTAPKKAKITFTSTSSGTPYSTSIDSLTGLFSTDVPAGNYERKLQADKCFEVIDTIVVNNDTTMNDLQAIENLGITSTYFTNVLDEVKTLTFTRDSDPNKIMERWKNTDQPINVFARNYDAADTLSMPSNLRACFDSAISDIVTKSDSIVQFNETSSYNSIGVNFEYRKNAQMTIPGVDGFTAVEESYPDGSPKKVRIEINRETVTPISGEFVFRREDMRLLVTVASSPDPSFIQGSSSTATELHHDEGLILQIMYKLNNLTNMFKHKNVVYNGVAGNPPEQAVYPFKAMNLSNYPNPATSYTNIKFNLPTNERAKVSLYNITGQKLDEKVIDGKEGSNNKTIDVKNMVAGVYMISVETGGNKALAKLIVVK